MRASAWYDKTWTGEQGYYTNTSAGYMGNNKATGCEFNWRYAKRDMVGSAGSNMGISLEVFAPSLIKYMRDTSGKHADKILCKEDGVHIFDAAPIITAELRKAVHDFNMLRIRWAYVEHSKVFRLEWQHAADFFTDEGEDVVKSFGRSSQSSAPVVDNLVWLDPESKVAHRKTYPHSQADGV
jgi:hypothetical protein